jgi:hypothetical protein
MILGVISFTFVVSNINTILSQSNKKNKKKGKCLIYLEQIRKKYNLSKEAVNMVKNEVVKGIKDFSPEDVDKIPKYFPPKIKTELYLSMYKDKLKKIKIFKPLSDDVLITLGHAITPIIYTPSNLPICNNSETVGYIPKETSQIKYIS